MDSILNTIKQALGIESDYNGFDTNVILDINSALSNLTQLGVGPLTGFIIKGSGETWQEFLGTSILLEDAKSYILFKVRLSFDPPTNSFLVDSIQKQINEIEWRLMVKVDPPCSLTLEEVTLTKIISVSILEEVI